MTKSFRDITLLVLFTIILWVGYEVYMEYNDTALPDVEQSIATPLDPTLNKDILEDLSKRVSY